jgi:hypothetical protein
LAFHHIYFYRTLEKKRRKKKDIQMYSHAATDGVERNGKENGVCVTATPRQTAAAFSGAVRASQDI